MSENKQSKPAEEKKDSAHDGSQKPAKSAEPKEEELVSSLAYIIVMQNEEDKALKEKLELLNERMREEDLGTRTQALRMIT